MANLTRNFTQGKMNKMVDERLVPNGEYVDALNVRMGSTEGAEIGVIENSKGNLKVTTLQYNGEELSSQARCIGAFEDGANETIYWMVHDPNFTSSNTGKLDLVVSWNANNNIVVYHLISMDDGGGVNTTLNFNELYLHTGIDLVDNKLLFFTDNLNAPRKINVQKNYPDPDGSGVDGFLAEDILVIKKPPLSPPGIQLIQTGSQENFLEERFICFAYRYRYDDDEYSATSIFTRPAFSPGTFLFSGESYLNEGMTNLYNTALVTFNTGGPLVKGVDLLFKEANSPVIKVIEKLNKSEQGYTDFQNVTYSFTNSKIFTILSEAEILRLYDNVPRFAQAQTLMGNRLMYGNYDEGYDLINYLGTPVRLDFTTEKVTESFEAINIVSDLQTSEYTIQGVVNVAESKAEFDFGAIDLVEGATVTLIVDFEHDQFSGANPPTETNEEQSLQFTFTILQDYNTVFEWINDAATVAQIGTSLPGGNIQPMVDREEGSTMSDAYNRIWKADLDGTALIYQSGISAIEQAIQVDSTAGSSVVTFTFPAVQYADNITTPTQINTEYFKIASAEADYSKLGSGESLHSNRGYEIGMIYMDEFGRSTPALVSEFNAQQFICDDSDTANSIYVNIPESQLAPEWATRYKFAIKPDRESYDTIFSSIFFNDPETQETYFLLEGENSQKITDGQRLIVKRDADGPTSGCVFATVLQKEAQEKGFLDIPAEGGGGDEDGNIPIPSGTYMKIRPNSFSTEQGENAIVDFGCKQTTEKDSGDYPLVTYPVNLEQPDPNIAGSSYTDYTIPANSRIVFDIKVERKGSGNKCEGRRWDFERTLTASQDYDNFFDWFEGDNIDDALETLGVSSIGNPGSGCDFTVEYLGEQANQTLPGNLCIIYFGFYRNPTTNQLKFMGRGTRACGSSKKRRSVIRMCITVFRADNTCIFESEPLDASPDVWYEGEESFQINKGTNNCLYTIENDDINDVVFNYIDIDGQPQEILILGRGTAGSGTTVTFVAECGSAQLNPTTPPVDPSDINVGQQTLTPGLHLGNIQNQTDSQPAICDTKFFNCYAFGNGVESYRIRDSILGKDFQLGNRVTSTQAIDYKEIRRFADITYSGVFNDESNVNKLNEFNFGLLNFKALEESFGPIQKLFARETDVLTLQEDKISYVLAGKNLLSDAGTGNLLQSVPEVLGTQIARIEEFGISHNPESFAQWGPDKYFTDAKRGSVLKLSGTSYQNDSLETISGYGMRTWFRDLFNVEFETQKLGGFDPYMNEFVLTSNQQLIPIEIPCTACGITQEITITPNQSFDVCFEMGTSIGPLDVSWSSVTTSGMFDVEVTYAGTTQNADNQTGPGSITVNKNSQSITEVSVKITPVGSSITTLTLSVECPDAKTLTVVDVVLTGANEAFETIHTQKRFYAPPFPGGYQSPLTTTFVQFDDGAGNPILSYYASQTGEQGQGAIPSTGDQQDLVWAKWQGDTATWDNNSNRFRYLRTSVNYAQTSPAMQQLVSASTPMATVEVTPGEYYKGNFTVPSGNDGDYLYLIWDLRKPTTIDLCSGQDILTACCCIQTPE